MKKVMAMLAVFTALAAVVFIGQTSVSSQMPMSAPRAAETTKVDINEFIEKRRSPGRLDLFNDQVTGDFPAACNEECCCKIKSSQGTYYSCMSSDQCDDFAGSCVAKSNC